MPGTAETGPWNADFDAVSRETLRQVRRSDPWLQLAWQDFLDLCETRQDGFL